MIEVMESNELKPIYRLQSKYLAQISSKFCEPNSCTGKCYNFSPVSQRFELIGLSFVMGISVWEFLIS